MKVMLPEDVKIGDWISICCCLDAEEIKTQEQLDTAKKDLEEGEFGVTIYESKLEMAQNNCSCETKPCLLLTGGIDQI